MSTAIQDGMLSYLNERAREHIGIDHIDRLKLSVRTANALRDNQIYLICDLINKSRHELLRVPNIGSQSIRDIEKALSNIGIIWPKE